MNIGTTSIDSLPVSPQTQTHPQMQQQGQGQGQENIKLDIANIQQAREADLKQAQQQPTIPQLPQNAMSQQSISQFVTGLQQASQAGLTALPSRDIPQTQTHLTQDQHMQPNYVPQAQQNDYITDHQSNEDIIRRHAQKEQQSNSLDSFYNNLQTPILIAILYFLFQLPVVRKNVFKFAPALFSADGNPNLIGYVINSAIFAGLYFSMTKGISYFSL